MYAYVNIPAMVIATKLDGHDVDNDETLELLAKLLSARLEPELIWVAPSDMMDGRILAIRNKFVKNGS